MVASVPATPSSFGAGSTQDPFSGFPPVGRAPVIPFSQPDYDGRLVVFEGVDGSGKSSSLALAADHLLRRGVDVVSTDLLSPECRRLPYFRAYADDPASVFTGRSDQLGVALVCLGDRIVRYRCELRRRLESGAWVLADRYVFTGLAEALAFGRPAPELAVLAQVAGLLPRPDLGFVATAGPEVVLARIRTRATDAGKVLHPSFYERAIAGFAAVGRANGLVELDTTRGADAVADVLTPRLDRLLESDGAPSERRRG